MAKKKSKPVKLSYKGKALNKQKMAFVKSLAEFRNVDPNNPKKLKKFYEDHKDLFQQRFETEFTSIPYSSTRVFSDIDRADNKGKSFFIEKDGKRKEISANQLKYEISKVELQLNNLFGASGATFQYLIDYDDNLIVRLPDFEDEKFYQDETTEIIVDHFSDDYGINVYISEPQTKEEKAKHKEYIHEYTTKAKTRIKQYKPKQKRNKSKSNTKKSRTKRKRS